MDASNSPLFITVGVELSILKITQLKGLIVEALKLFLVFDLLM